MGECNFVKHDFCETPNMYPNLNTNILNEQQLRLNKINEIKDYLLAEIRDRELITKNLSKYIASFEYFSKSVILLSVVASSIFIIICNSYWSTCRNNGGNLWSYIFNYNRICKKAFKNDEKQEEKTQ